MRLKRCRGVFLLCVLLLSGSQTAGRSNAETPAKLFTRYEGVAGANRLGEDVLTLTLSLSAEERKTVAIRVCSKEPMPFALATAGADPFRIAELLTDSHGYTPEQVMYLRSEDCSSSKAQAKAVTEVWAVPQGASLPTHVQAFTSNEVMLTSLGKEQANRGARDYKTASQKLVQNLRANPSSVGVVFGYFLERPSPVLRRRLREVRRTLEQSGLPQERYLVRPKAWDDEVSTYPPDAEPQYPSVFVVEVMKANANARK